LVGDVDYVVVEFLLFLDEDDVWFVVCWWYCEVVVGLVFVVGEGDVLLWVGFSYEVMLVMKVRCGAVRDRVGCFYG